MSKAHRPPRLIGMIQLRATKLFASGDGPPKWEHKSNDLAFDVDGRAWYLVMRLERGPSESWVTLRYIGWRLADDLPFDDNPAGADIPRRLDPWE